MLSLTVGDKGEDYQSIQEAIEAVPYNVKAEIVVSEGVYQERLFSDKKDLTLRGIGDVRVISSAGGYEMTRAGRKLGTFRSQTAFFSGERLRLENISLINDAGPYKGQALALYLDVDDAVLEKVTLESYQDTLFLAPLPEEERERNGFYGPRYLLPRKRNRTVLRDCCISGTIDFIFGGGDALFEACRVISLDDGFVTAPSGKRDWTGLVFHRTVFSGTGRSYLMRPWRPEGKAAFINCGFGNHIDPALFIPWPGREDEAGLATLSLYKSGVPDNISDKEAARLLSAFSC